jgi:hypothetical protein
LGKRRRRRKRRNRGVGRRGGGRIEKKIERHIPTKGKRT